MGQEGSILRYIDGVWGFVNKGHSKCLGSAGHPKRNDLICFVRRIDDDGDYVSIQNLAAHQHGDTDEILRTIPANTLVKGLGKSSLEGKALSEILEEDVYYDYNLQPLPEPSLAPTE